MWILSLVSLVCSIECAGAACENIFISQPIDCFKSPARRNIKPNNDRSIVGQRRRFYCTPAEKREKVEWKKRDKNRRSSPCVREQWPPENDWRPNISILKKMALLCCHFARSKYVNGCRSILDESSIWKPATLQRCRLSRSNLVVDCQWNSSRTLNVLCHSVGSKPNVKCGRKLTTFSVSIFL